MGKHVIGVLGASSLVGRSLLPLLEQESASVVAFSRNPERAGCGGEVRAESTIRWERLPVAKLTGSMVDALVSELPAIEHWIVLAPIWVLPDYFPLLVRSGARRVVALSSTSRFSKGASPEVGERELAQRLVDAEQRLKAWAEPQNIAWTILQPTMIYGYARDQNVTRIAGLVRRYRFFPLLGRGSGLRQPVHVDDVALACLQALHRTGMSRSYVLSGAECLTYREMVARIATALGQRPRLLPVPLSLLRLAVTLLRQHPRYRHLNMAMVARMNQDLVFAHRDAARDLAFSPRAFHPTAVDVGSGGQA